MKASSVASRGVFTKLIALTVSVVLAFGMTPSLAFATSDEPETASSSQSFAPAASSAPEATPAAPSLAFGASGSPLEAVPLPLEMATQAGETASGYWGTCKWELTSEGVLKIHPGEAGDVYAAQAWRDHTYSITAISAPVENGKKIICPDSMDYVFCALSELKSADLSGLDTSNTTSMNSVFNSCSALTSLNIKGWTTGKVTNMANMFGGCEKLKTLSLSAFDTKNVRFMNGMFASCKALTTLDLSSFDTRNVTDIRSMFTGCSSLKTLDLSRFNTSSVTQSDYMFDNCTKLNKVKVGSGYKIVDKSMIPGATSRTGMWWSTSKKTWLTEDAIVAKRSQQADTYLASGKNVGKASLANAQITLSQYTFTYTGAKRIPQVTVTLNGKTLIQGVDYKLLYLHCRNAGKATVQVTGKGLFEGEKTASYKILPVDISNVSFGSVSDVTYSGKAFTPEPKGSYNEKSLSSKDCKFSYKDNVKAGTASIVVTGKGNYTGKRTITFKIRQADISKAKVSEIKPRTYTGKKIEPSVKVTLNGKTLGTKDYSLVYANNIDVGTALVTISGEGNYKGTTKAKFEIEQASISGAKIADIPEQAFTGKPVEPSPKITWNGMTLHAGSDYSLSYENNKESGTATLVAKGEGNFKGKVSTTFEIGKAANPMVVKATAQSVAYNEISKAGKTLHPLSVSNAAGEVTYTLVSKDRALSFNTNTGALTVAQRTIPGTYQAKVKVTAAGTNKYAAKTVTVTLKVTVSGTAREDEEEDNNSLSSANWVSIGADMYGVISSQTDDDWFHVYVEQAGTYKLTLYLDKWVDGGGSYIGATLYENSNQLADTKKDVRIYVANEGRSASTTMKLPKGHSYVHVSGGLPWPYTFSYHFRLSRA